MANISEEAIKKRIATARAELAALTKEQRRSLIERLIHCLDLTTLNATDTPQVVARLCAKAKQHGTAAICIYPLRLPDVTFMKEDVTQRPRIAATAGGFPSGQYPIETRCAEVRQACAMGAEEIDIVINRSAVIDGQFDLVESEVRAMRVEAPEDRGILLKTILATGELPNNAAIYAAANAAIRGRSDFIKTSTGMEKVNATLEAACVMLQAIKDQEDLGRSPIGLKPAGGIRTADDALSYALLFRQFLGDDRLNPRYFRLGASSLLDALLAELAD